MTELHQSELEQIYEQATALLKENKNDKKWIMKKLYMTLGLPASGKSTWAKEMQIKDPNIVRVNKDDLRAMLHNGKHTRGNEKQVLRMRDQIIVDSLKLGKDVIVDDTNFHPPHEVKLKELAVKHNAKFKIIDFTDIPLNKCIENDLKRPKSVGAKIIKEMHKKYIKGEVERGNPLNPLVFDKDLPYCFIVDLDGTLAHIHDRSPFDGKSCASDLPNSSVIQLVNHLYEEDGSGYRVILFSGRNGESEPETIEWLKKNKIKYHELHMRKPGDMRKDLVVKKEMLDTFIKDKYNVVGVIDDRKQVKRMWVENGLTVFDVNQNDVEF